MRTKYASGRYTLLNGRYPKKRERSNLLPFG
jgi:hypothetical protein